LAPHQRHQVRHVHYPPRQRPLAFAADDDKTQRQALWTKFAQAWFPGGVDDPDLALVRVTVSHTHYWNVSENKLTQLLVMAKAVFTGEKPDLGESGEVSLGSGSKTE